MRIKELLVESFKSPFLNLLAIVNLSLMAFLVSNAGYNHSTSTSVIYELNGPAIIASIILTGSMKSFILVPPLIYLQWISIGIFDKLVASQIKLKTD